MGTSKVKRWGDADVERLVKKAKKGDRDAFVELMEANKLSMIACARALLPNEEDVADAVQETVLSAYQKLCTLREEKYFKTWLMRILINNCYSVLRQKKTVPLEDFLVEYGEEEDRDTPLDIRAALEDLSGSDRLTLTLFYVEDMSQKEISKVLDISENAVKRRLARSRRHFKERYLKGEVFDEETG